MVSHFTLILTLPGEQALKAVSVSSKGTVHKDGHVSVAHGAKQGSGPSSMLQPRKLRLRETKYCNGPKMHSSERRSPGSSD